jgi:hypothetical protein
MSVMFFVGTQTTFEYVVSLRTDYEDECELTPTISTLYIFGKKILLVRNV